MARRSESYCAGEKKRLLMELCRVLSLLMSPLMSHAGVHAAELWACVPANATAVVYSPDVVLLNEHWHQTAFSRLARDERMQSFVARMRNVWQPLREQGLSDSAQVRWQDILDVSSGPLCWFMASDQEEKKPGFVVVLEAKGRTDDVDLLLQRIDKACAAADAARHTIPEVSDTAFLYKFSAETVKNRTVRAFFRHDDYLVVCSRQTLALSIHRRLVGDELPALIDAPDWQAVTRHCHGAAKDAPAHLRWHLVPFPSTNTAAAPADARNKTFDLLKRQGFGQISAVGGVLTFANGEHDVTHHCFIVGPADRNGAARALDFTPLKSARLPAWIPSSVSSVDVFGWNLESALQGYASWFDASYAEGEQGVFEAVLSDIRDEKGGPEVDVRTDLVAQLDGPLVRLRSQVQTEDGETLMHAIAARDPSLVARSVRRLLEGDPGVRRVEIDEDTFWEFVAPSDSGDLGLAGLGPDMTGICIGVARDYLVVSTDIDCVRLVVKANPDDSLVETPGFRALHQRLTKRLPIHPIRWWVAPTSQAYAATYRQLRTGSTAKSSAVLAALIRQTLASSRPTHSPSGWPSVSATDFAELPPFSQIKHHLPPAYGFAQAIDDGWLLSEFYVAATDKE